MGWGQGFFKVFWIDGARMMDSREGEEMGYCFR